MLLLSLVQQIIPRQSSVFTLRANANKQVRACHFDTVSKFFLSLFVHRELLELHEAVWKHDRITIGLYVIGFPFHDFPY